MSLIRKNNFDEPVNNISHVHEVLQRCASKSVNQFLSLRNWLFSYYIVKYEQNGEDKADTRVMLLLPECENIFAKYPLSDDFAYEPEYELLYTELRHNSLYPETHGIQ